MIPGLIAKTKLLLVIFVVLANGTAATERWSRQLPGSGFQTASSAVNDWIPLAQPSATYRNSGTTSSSGQNDRTGSGRVLNYQPHPHHQPPFAPHIFTSNGNVQHQPPPQFALVHGEPFSLLGQRFVLPQQQVQLQQDQIPQFQPPNGLQSLPQYQVQKVNQQQPNQIKQQSLGGNQQQYQVVSQQQQHQKLQQQQLHIQPPRQQQVQYQTLQMQQPQPILSSYSTEQTSKQFVEEQLAARQKPKFIEANFAQPTPQVEPLIQSQPILHYSEQQTINKNNQQQVQQSQQSQQQQTDEEVQLLYVPLDALYQQKNQPGFQSSKYNILQQLNPAHINDFYTQLPPSPAPSTTSTTSAATTSTSKPVLPSRGSYNRDSETSSITSKPKAHQPPLAMYMFNDKHSVDSSINDVLTTLRKTKTISVLDSLSSQSSPKVFVGPSGLKTPEGYSKFDLPYLSSIDHNRFERRVENLPFFVAPLSYRAPNGFEKIPLPAPHVGSVIVNIPSNTIDTEEKQSYKQSTFISSTKKPAFFPTEEQYISPVTQTYSNFFTDATPINNVNKKREQYTTVAPREYITTPSQIYNSYSPNYDIQSTITPQLNFQENYEIEENQPTFKPFPQRNVSRPQIKNRHKTFAAFNTQVINEEYFNVRKPQEESLIQQQETVPEIPAQQLSYQSELSYTKSEPKKSNSLESYVPVPSTPNYDEFGLSTAISSLKWAEQSTASPKRGNQYTKVNEEQRMKTYFREQPAFKSRPVISTTSSTTTQQAPSSYEQISYSTTPSYSPSSTQSSLNFHESEDFVPFVSSQAPIQTPTEYTFNREQSTQRSNYYETNNRQQERETYSIEAQEQDKHKTSQNLNNDQTHSVHKFRFVDSVRPGYSHSTIATPTTTAIEENSYVQHKDVIYGRKHSEQPKYPEKPIVNKYKYNIDSDQADYSVKPLPTTIAPPTISPTTEQSTFSYPQEETYFQTPQYVEYNRESNQKQLVPKTSAYAPMQENGEDDEQRNTYHLPSELPPLSGNLPGLVNSLMEFDKTDDEIPPTTTTRTVITRRPLNRGRRPPATRSSTSTTEATTRRVVQRGRRPLISRPQNTEYNYNSTNVTSTTSRTTPSRSAIIRNPNRIRYNPTTEERRNYRPRSRNNNIVKIKEEENLDYQRDVLKQNYPVIKTTIQTTTDLPTFETTIINSYSENLNNHQYNTQYDTFYQESRDQQPIIDKKDFASTNNIKTTREKITTFAPSTENEFLNTDSPKEHFIGLQEPMQVAQEYYNTNDEQVDELHKQQDYPKYYQDSQKVYNGNKITTSVRPVYVQSTTPAAITTTIEPIKIRRPGPAFIRRPARPLNPTITSTTQATTTADYESLNQDKYTTRPKTRLDAAQRHTRIRSRMRKPTTTTTTEIAEEVNTNNNYYQRNQYKNDYFTESPSSDEFRITVAPYEDRTQHSRFRLEGQESQWSTKLSHNSFHPIDLDIRGKSLKDVELDEEEEKEPEIITAGYEEFDTFTVNVTPGIPTLFEKGNAMLQNKTEFTLDEIVDKMTLNEDDKLSKNSNEIIEQLKNDNVVKENKENSRRRGIWRRVRVRPIDQFETAESQNIGQHLFNTILNEKSNKKLDGKLVLNDKTNYNIIYDVKTDDIEEKYTENKNDTELTTVLNENTFVFNNNNESTAETNFESTTTEYPEASTNNFEKDSEILTTVSQDSEDESEGEYENQYTTPFEESEKEEKVEEAVILTTQPHPMGFDYSESETTTEKIEDIKSEDTSSMFDEVKQKLVDLFFSNDADDELENHETEFKTKQEYTNIERSKLLNENEDVQTTTELTESSSLTESSVSPKDPMGSLILATSTSKEISHETEICYRGRCIKTDMNKKID